jgi:flavin reductase (DIM6/NTAB) family NADH-FMN oxidoreductase RutF
MSPATPASPTATGVHHRMDELSAAEAYKVLTSAVLPRPIAWVSTRSPAGIDNLAPFSFFTVASRQPPMLFLSIGPDARPPAGQPPATPGPPAAEKDTLANIRATGEFVVNVVSEDLLAPMIDSSAEVPAATGEFDLAGLDRAPCQRVGPFRVAAAPLALECELRQLYPLGTDVGVVGEVVALHAAPGVFDDWFHVDVAAVRPVGRMPGPHYALGLTSIPDERRTP